MSQTIKRPNAIRKKLRDAMSTGWKAFLRKFDQRVRSDCIREVDNVSADIHKTELGFEVGVVRKTGISQRKDQPARPEIVLAFIKK